MSTLVMSALSFCSVRHVRDFVGYAKEYRLPFCFLLKFTCGYLAIRKGSLWYGVYRERTSLEITIP
jgi:hypothetical protein